MSEHRIETQPTHVPEVQLLDDTNENHLLVERRCGAPAPLVANGAIYVGCGLEKGHEGMHETTVKWS